MPESSCPGHFMGAVRLSQGRTATLSTQYVPASQFGPQNAVDGLTNGNYTGGNQLTIVENGTGWWQVDLGANRAFRNRQLARYTLPHRRDGEEHRVAFPAMIDRSAARKHPCKLADPAIDARTRPREPELVGNFDDDRFTHVRSFTPRRIIARRSSRRRQTP